jgi:hypothetical protein
METRLAEMRIKLSLKKASAANTKRRPNGFNTFPTRVADLTFIWRIEQNRTHPAGGGEKNELEIS